MSSIVPGIGDTERNQADPTPYSCPECETIVTMVVITATLHRTVLPIVLPHVCTVTFTSHNVLRDITLVQE